MIKESVLVTAIGSMSSASVIERLKDKYRVVGTSIYERNWISESVLVDAFYKISPAKDESDYIYEIIEIIKREGIQYIIPLTDVEVDVMNKNRASIEQLDCIICISGENTIDICRDKERIEKHLKLKTDVKCIPTISKEEVIINNIFPCILKPKRGRSSEGIEIINDKEYLDFVSKRVTCEYLLQPYIGGDVVCVDLIRQKMSNLSMLVSRKELLRTKNGAGISVHVFCDKGLNEICNVAAEALDINGCVNFEFIQTDNGDYYFMECNPRFSGGINFSMMSSGYDFINNHVNCFGKGCKIDAPVNYGEMYIAKRYVEYEL